jgi:hypothetical protein
MKTDELDRLVVAGTIKEIDREHVRFIVRRIVQPPERNTSTQLVRRGYNSRSKKSADQSRREYEYDANTKSPERGRPLGAMQGQ